MKINQLSKKTAESLGGIGSMLTGLFCAAVSVMDAQGGQSIWRVWVMMSVVLVVNGIAMILHARRRDDSALLPAGLPLPLIQPTTTHTEAKARL